MKRHCSADGSLRERKAGRTRRRSPAFSATRNRAFRRPARPRPTFRPFPDAAPPAPARASVGHVRHGRGDRAQYGDRPAPGVRRLSPTAGRQSPSSNEAPAVLDIRARNRVHHVFWRSAGASSCSSRSKAERSRYAARLLAPCFSGSGWTRSKSCGVIDIRAFLIRCSGFRQESFGYAPGTPGVDASSQSPPPVRK